MCRWLFWFGELVFTQTWFLWAQRWRSFPCWIVWKLFFFSSELLFQQRIQSSPVICDPDSISVCVMKYLEGRTLNIASLKSSNYSDVILLTCSVLKEYFSNESQGKVKHITPESTARWVNLIKHWLMSVWLFAFYLALHLWFITSCGQTRDHSWHQNI